jgi:hypothetical protein
VLAKTLVSGVVSAVKGDHDRGRERIDFIGERGDLFRLKGEGLFNKDRYSVLDGLSNESEVAAGGGRDDETVDGVEDLVERPDGCADIGWRAFSGELTCELDRCVGYKGRVDGMQARLQPLFVTSDENDLVNVGVLSQVPGVHHPDAAESDDTDTHEG